ncbi:MAG: hypothetical protein QOH26_2128, partial [Actinomycetota bacterium]|nr:hypothetical protein [Actinomycetota bacterium]
MSTEETGSSRAETDDADKTSVVSEPGGPDSKAETTVTPAASAAPEEKTATPAAQRPTVQVQRAPANQKKKRSVLAKVTEIPILILLAFGIAILIKTFLVQAFYIPSGSMLP